MRRLRPTFPLENDILLQESRYEIELTTWVWRLDAFLMVTSNTSDINYTPISEVNDAAPMGWAVNENYGYTARRAHMTPNSSLSN